MAADCEMLMGDWDQDEQKPDFSRSLDDVEHEEPIFTWSEIIFSLIVIGGFSATLFWLMPALEAEVEQKAHSAAKHSSALLYHHNIGFGPLIGCVAWLMVGGWVEAAIKNISGNEQGAATRLQFGFENQQDDLQSHHFIARFLRQISKHIGLISILFLLVSVLVTARELNAYVLYFSDRYEQRHTLQLDPTVRYWTDATFVEVGCNVGSQSSNPVYRVHFKDRSAAYIETASPISTTWLTQMEKIDASLVQAGAQFKPWSWLDRDPYHPQCLKEFADLLGPTDFARFERLIRAPHVARDVITNEPR